MQERRWNARSKVALARKVCVRPRARRAKKPCRRRRSACSRSERAQVRSRFALRENSSAKRHGPDSTRAERARSARTIRCIPRTCRATGAGTLERRRLRAANLARCAGAPGHARRTRWRAGPARSRSSQPRASAAGSERRRNEQSERSHRALRVPCSTPALAVGRSAALPRVSARVQHGVAKTL